MYPYADLHYPPPGDPGDLDLPYYGIGFPAAIGRYFRKYARFDGRTGRGEYGWPLLLDVIVGVVALTAGLILSSVGAPDPGTNYQPLQTPGEKVAIGIFIAWGVYYLATVVPRYSVQVRRLHDAGYTGWLALLRLVTGAGLAILILSLAIPSRPAGTAYDRWKEPT